MGLNHGLTFVQGNFALFNVILTKADENGILSSLSSHCHQLEVFDR